MAFAGGSSNGIKNEINVTPLVDVVLVLLIIFMVITPMLQRGKDVVLPRANKHSDEEKKTEADPLVVSITADKRVWIESDGVGPDGLQVEISTELSKTPGRKILLKGDENLSIGDVRKVMKDMQQAGARGVGLGVEEKEDGKKK